MTSRFSLLNVRPRPHWRISGLYVFCLTFVLVVAANISLSAAQSGTKYMLDFNAYPIQTATKNDNFATINAAANLGNGFSYFSLNNFGRTDGVGGTRKSTFYTEQNLRWAPLADVPLDLTFQANIRSGDDNDRYRFGIRWRLNNTPGLDTFFKAIYTVYAINFHVVQIDHEDAYVWQMEHAFSFNPPAFDGRFYIAGFVDHTFNQDLPATLPKSPIVGEAQAGYRIFNNFYVVSEFRINDYRQANVSNLAIGLQYKVSW